MSREEIEGKLVTELRTLEAQRREHSNRYPAARVDREDPDVARMIEALAVFSLRTRMSLLSNLQSTWRRLFASYFDFLLSPLPSCAIVQAGISARVVETSVVERGSQLRLTCADGRSATFMTLAELRILPITLDQVEYVPAKPTSTEAKQREHRLYLRFSSRHPRTDVVGLLRLHLYCAGHYESALRLQYRLQAHLRRAVIFYNPEVGIPLSTETEGAQPCSVSFGHLGEDPLRDEPENPQDLVRRFFHFPERELYLNVQVPAATAPWQNIVLCLELGPDYVPEPEPDRDTFLLFTTPVENRVPLQAAQILVDGKSSAYGLRSIDPNQHLSLLRVNGVYRLQKQGRVPLRPAALAAADGDDSYEMEEVFDQNQSSHQIVVRAPSALLNPMKLQVDCDWHQPWFAGAAVGKVRVTHPHRSLPGITLGLLGGVHAPHNSQVREHAQGLLQFLSLRMKPVLNRQEILRVIDVLGTVGSGPYRRMPAFLGKLRVEPALDSALRGSGLRHVYTVNLEPFHSDDEPLLWHFLRQLQVLLDSWNAEAAVELVVNSATPFALPVGGQP